MRRRMLWGILLLALLTGCAGERQPAPPEEDPPAQEEEQPAAEPDREEPESGPAEPGEEETAPQAPPAEEPGAAGEPEPPALETPPETVPEPEPPETPKEPGEELLRAAMAAYAEITERLTFTLYVEEGDGTGLNLSITPENAWTVEGRENLFPVSYQWSAASAADWAAQVGAMGEGDLLLEMASPDGATGLRCCTAGDVVAWTAAGETAYAHAACASQDDRPMSGLLRGIAEDALWDAAFYGPAADGALTDYEEIARQLNEAMAENIRSAPDWVTWKPLDFQAGGASVFDAYYGQPQNFCAGIGFRLLLDDPGSVTAGTWQAGAGLGEPDADGYYGWGRAALVRKNAAGDWSCADMGTGGYSVDLPLSAAGEEAPLSELVDAFFLTEGESHDWFVPYYILHHTADEMAALPALLDQRTDAQARELCAALRECLGTADYGGWTPETLAAALGSYGAYLEV